MTDAVAPFLASLLCTIPLAWAFSEIDHRLRTAQHRRAYRNRIERNPHLEALTFVGWCVAGFLLLALYVFLGVTWTERSWWHP